MALRVDELAHRRVQVPECISGAEVAFPQSRPPPRDCPPVFGSHVPQVRRDPFPMAFHDIGDGEVLELKFRKGRGQHALDAVASWMTISADQRDTHAAIIPAPLMLAYG